MEEIDFVNIKDKLNNGTLLEKMSAIAKFSKWCQDLCLMAGSMPHTAFAVACEISKGLEGDYIEDGWNS